MLCLLALAPASGRPLAATLNATAAATASCGSDSAAYQGRPLACPGALSSQEKQSAPAADTEALSPTEPEGTSTPDSDRQAHIPVASLRNALDTLQADLHKRHLYSGRAPPGSA